MMDHKWWPEAESNCRHEDFNTSSSTDLNAFIELSKDEVSTPIASSYFLNRVAELHHGTKSP